MDLNQLARFMDSKRSEFERAVSSKAKNLELADVTREIKLDTWTFTQRKFKDGQSLDFLLCQGHYAVIVNRQELVLRGNYGIEVARFGGDEVKSFYDSLSTAILKAEAEELESLPF